MEIEATTTLFGPSTTCPADIGSAPTMRLVRPCLIEGKLIEAHRAPLFPRAIVARCLPAVASHLSLVCLWHEDDRGVTWDENDSSFYALEFFPTPRGCLYVQALSYPGRPVLIEVSSGQFNPYISRYLTKRRRRDLHARGFRLKGGAKNFQKFVDLKTQKDVRALAFEMLYLMVHVLGCRDQREMSFTFCLERGGKNR